MIWKWNLSSRYGGVVIGCFTASYITSPFTFPSSLRSVPQVLVGKTLHVAMLELMQEEELEAIRRQQSEFELVRKIELSEVQRLEAEARRKAQEKERRIAQERKRVEEKRKLEEKIAAKYFAQQYLGSLHTNVFDMLQVMCLFHPAPKQDTFHPAPKAARPLTVLCDPSVPPRRQDQGYFYDPLQKEIEEIVLVDLLAGLRVQSDGYEAAQEIADELIAAARAKAREYEEKARQMRVALEARLLLEAGERREMTVEDRLAADMRAATLTEAGDGEAAAEE